MLNVIVFSKDRACQLHAFLESWQRHVSGATPIVSWWASAEEFRRSYELLQSRFPWADWRERHDKREDILRAVDPLQPYTMFAVDDQVIVRSLPLGEWTVAPLENPDIACVSLRLSSAITRCYSMHLETPMPWALFCRGMKTPHGREWYAWNWREGSGDWGYPMSIDTTIFRTQDILPLLRRLPWNSPNTLENALAAHPLLRPKMACFCVHFALNVPANLVQKDYANRTCEGLSAAELNRRYLDGQTIDIEPLLEITNHSCHVEAAYQFSRRPPKNVLPTHSQNNSQSVDGSQSGQVHVEAS